MKRLGLLALMLAGIAPAQADTKLGPDHVYVYHKGGNINYQCTSYLTYVETDGASSATMSGCVVTGTDKWTWPVFPPQPIRLTLYLPKADMPWEGHCQFVAHAMAVNRSTSTVIDCR